MRIRYMTPGGEPRVADLFGTLAALVRDEVDDFPALRAHQRAPWHAFLAQVAALALLREGTRELPEEAGAWERLLLALTPDHPGGEAWRLVVDDWSKPALLQPPGMDPKLRKNPKAKRAETPDALDMLLTARNHDLKGERMRHAADDAWLFALVSLQTQEGQMGAGNYGVSRMNGGYGARVAFSLQPSEPTPGRSFGRDVRRLAAATEDAGGIALIWLERWDGASSIPFGKLHPLYVEVCRRVRLIGGEDGIAGALLGNSKVPRIAAKERHGVTGDPWAPVFHDRSKAWGVSAAGFGYRQMTTLLDGKKVQRPPLAIPSAADSRTGLTLVARAVTRGQGKTEGYHERHVRVPPADVGLMAAGSDRLANTAEKRTKDAGDAANILRHALRTLFQGGPDEVRHDDDATNAKLVPDVQSFDRAVDAVFFDGAFWKAATQTGEDVAQRHILAWRERLRDIAGNILRGGRACGPAQRDAPPPSAGAGARRVRRPNAVVLRGGERPMSADAREDPDPVIPEKETSERAERSHVAKLSFLFVRGERRPPDLSTAQSAPLRRMDAENPGAAAAALFAAMELAGLSASLGAPGRPDTPDLARRWATVVQMIALLAGTGGARAHDPSREAGRAIRAADYSEARLMRLLSSRGPTLRRSAVRLARFLAAKRAGALDLRPLAHLILWEGRDEEIAERARLRLARGYYGGRPDDETMKSE